MKNHHIERLRRAAKQYHRHQRLSFNHHGIRVNHDYTGLDPARLTRWDDVACALNDYEVRIGWIHPHMQYLEQLEAAAWQRVEQSEVQQTDNEACYRAFAQERAHLLQTAAYTICTDWQASWSRRARLVHLCAPIEVRNEADLRKLAALTKRLLKRETTLQQEFPAYVYKRENWIGEGWLDKDPGMLPAHRLVST